MKNCLKYFDERFWSELLALVIVVAVSIGLQCLLFSLGSVLNGAKLGMILDIVLFTLLMMAVVPMLNGSDLLLPLSARKSGMIFVACIWLAIAGIYVCVIYPLSVWWLIMCLLLLLLNWISLEKAGADTSLLSITVGMGLFYILGTYFAMLLNNIEPAIGGIGILAVAVATLVLWFKPCFCKH
jgi:hypothetical protein